MDQRRKVTAKRITELAKTQQAYLKQLVHSIRYSDRDTLDTLIQAIRSGKPHEIIVANLENNVMDLIRQGKIPKLRFEGNAEALFDIPWGGYQIDLSSESDGGFESDPSPEASAQEKEGYEDSGRDLQQIYYKKDSDSTSPSRTHPSPVSTNAGTPIAMPYSEDYIQVCGPLSDWIGTASQGSHLSSAVQSGKDLDGLTFHVPLWTIEVLNFYEDSPLSRVFTDYRLSVRQQLTEGVLATSILGGDEVEVDLFFRNRHIGEPYTVSTWACEVSSGLDFSCWSVSFIYK